MSTPLPFTQYMRPDGRRRNIWAPCPEGLEAKASAIMDNDWRFEAEVLTTGDVSLTVSDGSEDVAIEIAPNGPEVPRALARLIETAFTKLSRRFGHD
jgi:hypothetical protein